MTVYAKNGGSNEDCLVTEKQTCAVDCVIDTTGAVAVTAKNGGKSCYEVAVGMNEAGAQLDVNSYGTETHTVSLEELSATGSSNSNTYGVASLATGGAGVLLLAGLFVQGMRNHRRGYVHLNSRPVQAV